jgi:preprotein translocase subunit SecD
MLRASLAAVLILLAAACARTHRAELAIYDWEAQRGTTSEHGALDLRCKPEQCPDPAAETVYVFGAPKLTGDDLDRQSVRADVDPQTGQPVVIVELTPQGQERFEALTLKLAHRGAELGRPQHFLIVVDREVYASPYIDFRFNPDGIPADNRIQFDGLASLDETRKLARALRAD